MVINLRPELQRFVEQLILERQYATADEVIAAALACFAEAELRREVQKGMDEIRQGLATDWDVNEVKDAFLRRAKTKKKAS